MAVVAYVQLNSKKYAVFRTRYEPSQEKFQNVHVTVAGAHIDQNFDFTEYRWGFDLAVDYTPESGYGSWSDLQTAYALTSCAFVDHYGNAHTVYFEGPLMEQPFGPNLDGAATFNVPVTLRKKQ
jgi:hypothetical protein